MGCCQMLICVSAKPPDSTFNISWVPRPPKRGALSLSVRIQFFQSFIPSFCLFLSVFMCLFCHPWREVLIPLLLSSTARVSLLLIPRLSSLAQFFLTQKNTSFSFSRSLCHSLSVYLSLTQVHVYLSICSSLFFSLDVSVFILSLSSSTLSLQYSLVSLYSVNNSLLSSSISLDEPQTTLCFLQ